MEQTVMSQLEQYDLLTGVDTVVTASVASRSELIGAPATTDEDLWTDVINNLLTWRGGVDEICANVWESAIDFAVDQQRLRVSPPSSVAATDSGEICFEWRTSHTTHIVTIIESGVAEFVFLRNGQVYSSGTLRRNPRTRRLELEDEN